MADCQITATLLNADDSPAVGRTLTIVQAWRDRTSFYVGDFGKTVGPSDSSGVLTFNLPRGATVQLKGKVNVGGQSLAGGVKYAIPDQASANLEDLTPVVSVPQTNLSNHAALIASPTALGHIKGGGAGYTIDPDGTLQVPVVSAEVVEDYLSTFFNPTSPALHFTYNDPLNRFDVSLDDATHANSGLMSAGDKASFDLIPSTYATQVALAQEVANRAAAISALSSVYQPLDSDLSAIAALTPADNDLIQRKAGAWINRTPAQLKTDLALTKGDVGLGSVVNADTTTTANIADSLDKRFVTDAQRAVLGNTSGTNTGDQDLSGLVPKTTTVNGHALSANVSVTKSDVGLANVLNVAQEPAISAGLATQYWRGDKTWAALNSDAVPEGSGNLYFTTGRASAAAPVQSVAGKTGVVSLAVGDVSGAGTVSSVALTVPGVLFSVTGSPITTSGTLAFSLLNQTANTVLAGPTTGAAAGPTMRSLVAADIPTLTSSKISDFNSAASSAAPVQSVNGATGAVSLTLPANTTSTASQFFTAYNSTTGAFTKAQPAFSDISGTASAGQIPATLNATTFGGNVTHGASGVATVTTQYPSYDLIFQDSGWNTTTTSANTLTHTLRLIAGSGATGSIPNRLALLNNAGTEYVTFDGKNQRVGIGTTTPAQALDIVGSLSLTGNVFADFIRGNTNATNYVRLDSANQVSLNPGGASNFAITATTGGVGVNKSSSIGAQLHVIAKDASTKGIRVGMAASPSATSYPFSVADSTDATLAYVSTGGTFVAKRATYTGVVGTTTLNLANGNTQVFTFGAGNETIALSNIPDSALITLHVVQDATGSRTITWPAAIKWVGGSAPTLSTGASKRDVFVFSCDGTSCYETSRALDVR